MIYKDTLYSVSGKGCAKLIFLSCMNFPRCKSADTVCSEGNSVYMCGKAACHTLPVNSSAFFSATLILGQMYSSPNISPNPLFSKTSYTLGVTPESTI